LQVDVLVRTTCGLIRQLTINFFNGEFLAFYLSFLEYTNREFFSNINDSGGTIRATATTLGLEFNKNSEEVNTLGGEEINLSIGMHSKGKRSLWRQFVLNMLKILAMGGGNRALERSLSFSVGE